LAKQLQPTMAVGADMASPRLSKNLSGTSNVTTGISSAAVRDAWDWLRNDGNALLRQELLRL